MATDPKANKNDREFDLVIFGATGFTGGLTAEYLAENAPAGLKWALVGRNQEKLEALRDRLSTDKSELGTLELITADATDAESLASVAARTKCVITTVGPYLHHGEPLVKACAEAGTDYVDLTGEPEFVDRMYVKYHETAKESGARIVHACGFDSIPHDLGAMYTAQQLAATGPVDMRGVVRASGMFSGGTFHSAINAMSRQKQAKEALKERRELEKQNGGTSNKAKSVAGKPAKDTTLGVYLLPMPTVDPMIVARSARALDFYGSGFTYSHYAGVKTLRYAVGGGAGISTLALASQVKPLRQALLSRIKQGEGPDEAKREASWFTVDFIAESEGRSIHTRVRGGDPGYSETAKMLAESALCLVIDDNPATAGSVTTAQAMGDNLLARLHSAGITFEVV